MKKLLGVLLLIGMFNMNMQAAEVLEGHLQALELDKMIPVDLETDCGIVRTKYKESDFNRFLIFNDLFEHVSDDDDKPLCIPLGKATSEEFDLLVRMADPALEDSQRKLPQVVRDDREALLRLLSLARLFDPENPKTLYPITMGLLKKIEELPKRDGVGGNPRESELARCNRVDIVQLLDNFSDLITDKTYNQDPDAVRDALRVILQTNYLKDSLNNRNAELLIEGIKQRAVTCSNHSKFIKRINKYVFDDSESENVFPVVPKAEAMRPASDFFPLSVQDLITAGLMPELTDNNTCLNFRPQGLTCLSGLSNFRTLRRLDLNINKLRELPVGLFTGLTALQQLDLVGNKLTMLSAGTFTGLTALQRLNLGRNKLTTLSAGTFTGLTALQELFLYDNQLRDLPVGVFAGLTELRILHLHNNLITLPVGVFTDLTQLQRLYLSKNQLRELSDGVFAGLTQLRSLNLDTNNLITLPVGLFTGLTQLQELSLSKNQLRELPDGVFAGLTQLRSLDLDTNNLITLPVGVFEDLTTLQNLYLGGNKLTILPVGVFAGLTQLKGLNLDTNNLITLPVGVFEDLTQLLWLDLKNNQLTTLPVGVFAGLTALQRLYLHNNKLRELPVGVFTGLTELRKLDLDTNNLTTLPAGMFAGLTALKKFDLDGKTMIQTVEV